MPSFREALRFWLKLGLISFGGPAGQIAITHRELVEKRRWIGDGHFLHALNFCMLLPGPEAQQLATYLGWRLHGLRGFPRDEAFQSSLHRRPRRLRPAGSGNGFCVAARHTFGFRLPKCKSSTPPVKRLAELHFAAYLNAHGS